MPSPTQLAANRRNAAKSTGPKTAEGKAAASRNALRHGLTARQIVCYGERESVYAAFHATMRENLAPADEVEEQLVERIILCSWRLRRIARAERGLIDRESGSVFLYHETRISRSFERIPREMATLSRYEAQLDRSIGRAYAMLERRQAARRGEHVPPPLTVLVEGALADAVNPLQPQQKHENYETKPMLDVTSADNAAR
jgi:hypothetical protein